MRRLAIAPLAVALLAWLPGGCSSKPVGQLMLVVQTDLSLPKDIDTIRIEVSTAGVPKFKLDYTRLGTADGQIHLPGTLGLIAPEKPDDAVRVIVSARTGGEGGQVRVVRDIVTTVPAERVATLPVPIHFLCEGQGKDEAGNAVSTCAEGETCKAGACAENKVEPDTLPTYSDERVFGDGGCFDGTGCWTEPVVAVVDMATCTIPGAAGINVALQTEGQGICGPVGCFVTLDAESDEGWKLGEDGRIVLPKAVCDQITSGKIVNVVTQIIPPTCAEKTADLPTCGPWSSAKNQPPPYTGPTALAGAQPLPVALARSDDGVVWTNAGLMGAEGALKSIGIAGGVPELLTSMSKTPRALVTNAGAIYWTDSPGTPGAGSIFKLQGGTVTTLIGNLDAPEGIAVAANKVFWTDFQAGTINAAPLGGNTGAPLATGNYPYRLVADADYVYWTNEGTAGSDPPDGSVVRINHKTLAAAETVGPAQATPRAIALETGLGGDTTAIWWTTFGSAGSVVRALVLGGGQLGAPEVMATKLDYPNGIAVDADNVYWTNRGAGTVMSLPRSAKAGDAPITIATAQRAPGAIVVDESAIYWVSEGGSSDPSGAVVRLPKTK